MRTHTRAILPIFAMTMLLIVPGCIKAYVGPDLPKIAYADLKVPGDRPDVSVDIEFQTMGLPNLVGTNLFRGNVKNVLDASGLFSKVEFCRYAGGSEKDNRLFIVIDNTADLANAIDNIGNTAVGAMSLGLVDSVVVNNYKMTVTYIPIAGEPVERIYTHSIHSSAGKLCGFDNVKPMSPELALDTMFENLLLKLLYDLQQQGLLCDATILPGPATAHTDQNVPLRN